jgi:hypothetical protein
MIYFIVPLEKMEDMEFLKAELAEMNVNMKSAPGRMDTNRKADREKQMPTEST